MKNTIFFLSFVLIALMAKVTYAQDKDSGPETFDMVWEGQPVTIVPTPWKKLLSWRKQILRLKPEGLSLKHTPGGWPRVPRWNNHSFVTMVGIGDRRTAVSLATSTSGRFCPPIGDWYEI